MCSFGVPLIHRMRTTTFSASPGNLTVTRYEGEFLGVGWYPADARAVARLEQLTVAGHRMLASAEALATLRDGELAVTKVKAGFPNPGDRELEVLVSRR